jgi:hypothetical protein
MANQQMSEDDLFAFVNSLPMTEGGADASRAFWRVSDAGYGTVMHTNGAANHVHIQQYLRHCNPRPTTATPLSHDEAHAEWARISTGIPTCPGSTWFIVE